MPIVIDDPIPRRPTVVTDTIDMPKVPAIPPKNSDNEDPLILRIKMIRAKYPDISDEDLIEALKTGVVRFAPTPEW